MNRRLMILGFLGLVGLGAMPSQAMAYTARDYCREYTRTVTIGGRPEHAYGTACLQPDGQWLIVSEGGRAVYDRGRDSGPSRVIYIQDARKPYGYYKHPSYKKDSHRHHNHHHKKRYDDNDRHRW